MGGSTKSMPLRPGSAGETSGAPHHVERGGMTGETLERQGALVDKHAETIERGEPASTGRVEEISVAIGEIDDQCLRRKRCQRLLIDR